MPTCVTAIQIYDGFTKNFGIDIGSCLGGNAAREQIKQNHSKRSIEKATIGKGHPSLSYRASLSCVKVLLVVLDPHAIHIYTDGSCYKNPGGESGCAAIVHFPGHHDDPGEQILDFGCDESSINRMELMACVEAVKWICQNAPWGDVTRVLIVTDSQYITQNIIRAPGWKKEDWRNRSGEPKFNDDLWDKLLKGRAKAARAGVRVDFVWQKGKKTKLGKQVDEAAKTAAKRGGIDVDTNYRPGSVTRSMVKGGIAERFPAGGQVLVIRPYVKKIMH